MGHVLSDGRHHLKGQTGQANRLIDPGWISVPDGAPPFLDSRWAVSTGQYSPGILSKPVELGPDSEEAQPVSGVSLQRLTRRESSLVSMGMPWAPVSPTETNTSKNRRQSSFRAWNSLNISHPRLTFQFCFPAALPTLPAVLGLRSRAVDEAIPPLLKDGNDRVVQHLTSVTRRSWANLDLGQSHASWRLPWAARGTTYNCTTDRKHFCWPSRVTPHT